MVILLRTTHIRDMKNIPVSYVIKTARLRIESGIKRPLLLLGVVCALSACAAVQPLPANPVKMATPNNTTISAEGIVRTTLESYRNIEGDEFRLVLTTYPPGLSLASHHHPSVAFIYVLEGIAESQYVGEPLKTLKAGDTFQDKANEQHLIFRNADKANSLKYLISYTIKKGQPFLVIP